MLDTFNFRWWLHDGYMMIASATSSVGSTAALGREPSAATVVAAGAAAAAAKAPARRPVTDQDMVSEACYAKNNMLEIGGAHPITAVLGIQPSILPDFENTSLSVRRFSR